MKKLTAVFAVLILLLAACGQSGDNELTWQEQYDLGARYLSEGNNEEAIIAFSAAIEIDPMRAEAYVGRGDAYVLSGAEESLTVAQADYEKAIELDETYIEAYLGLVNIYIYQENPYAAWELLKQGYEKTGNRQLSIRMDELRLLINESLRKENYDIFEAVAELVEANDKHGIWECFLVNKQRIFDLTNRMIVDRLLVDTSYGPVLFCLDGNQNEGGFYVGDIQDEKRLGYGTLVHAYSQEELSWRILDSFWENDLPNGHFYWEHYDSKNGLAVRQGNLVNGFFDGEISGEDEFSGGGSRAIKIQFSNGCHVPLSGPDELGNYIIGEQRWNGEQPRILNSSDLETQFGVFPFATTAS